MSSESAYLDVISGRRSDWRAAALRGAFRGLEPVYSAGTAIRNVLFQAGLKRRVSAGVPVVSVGNLTTGGTGKTPVVAEVVTALQRLGWKPGIASRGYRSQGDEGNDEKRVLAILCPDVPHIQNRDRATAAAELVRVGADIVVLDDGFQHRRLKRDLDIVLIDATNPWGYGHQLPRGLLRESIRGLARAGLVVLTRADLVTASEREHLQEQIAARTKAPLVVSRFIPHGLCDSAGARHPASEWRGKRVVGFCGIGNPRAFQTTLERIGVTLTSHSVTAFADHHHYSDDDRQRLIAEAEATHAEGLVCTLKDLVKLPPSDGGLPILAVEIAFDVVDGAAAWDGALERLKPERKG
ncbi:MAG TPA: tetraacyldisaccharide 4'-kinase [Caulifigura sp.]|jgi:tetraacyldisaccharide 4'-kinase|nr:tetraacyldisaccharide 4'-kinase [Caulifigura sp.]